MVEIFMLEDFDTGEQKMAFITRDEVLVKYLRALTLLKTRKALETRKVLTEIAHEAPVLSYFLAETYFQEHDFSNATTIYEEFLNKNEGSAYIKDSHLKIGISAFYQNNISKF